MISENLKVVNSFQERAGYCLCILVLWMEWMDGMDRIPLS